jgi:predicted O-methyltransferase YrrM
MPLNIEKKLLAEVKGFLEEKEGRGLYEYALAAGHLGACLEIGSYCGKSTLYLGTACRENGGILFSIDHHRGSEEQQPGEAYFDSDLLDAATGRIDTFPHFRKTLAEAGLEKTVVPIVCDSITVARAWNTPLGLVFIDGGHALETVYKDYCAWATHILPGGFLLFHDIFTDPEKGGRAPYQVYRVALASGLFRERAMIETLGVLERVKCGEAYELEQLSSMTDS